MRPPKDVVHIVTGPDTPVELSNRTVDLMTGCFGLLLSVIVVTTLGITAATFLWCARILQSVVNGDATILLSIENFT